MPNVSGLELACAQTLGKTGVPEGAIFREFCGRCLNTCGFPSCGPSRGPKPSICLQRRALPLLKPQDPEPGSCRAHGETGERLRPLLSEAPRAGGSPSLSHYESGCEPSELLMLESRTNGPQGIARAKNGTEWKQGLRKGRALFCQV